MLEQYWVWYPSLFHVLSLQQLNHLDIFMIILDTALVDSLVVCIGIKLYLIKVFPISIQISLIDQGVMNQFLILISLQGHNWLREILTEEVINSDIENSTRLYTRYSTVYVCEVSSLIGCAYKYMTKKIFSLFKHAFK